MNRDYGDISQCHYLRKNQIIYFSCWFDYVIFHVVNLLLKAAIKSVYSKK